MNIEINRMHFKQTLRSIVLMVAVLATFGVHAHGRLPPFTPDESRAPDESRYRPFLIRPDAQQMYGYGRLAPDELRAPDESRYRPFLIRPDAQQMVHIPAGRFEMGGSDEASRGDERPVRTVYVDAFYMDTTEVTNAEFKAFVDANPAWQKDRIAARFARDTEFLLPWKTDYLQHWKGNTYPKGSGNAPVEFVNWYAAMAYAEWVGKRLPTEAEWEYAARGGLVGKKYPNGDTLTPKDANYRFPGRRGPGILTASAVARYAANGYGVYDMAGNVREWCLDAYHEDFYDTFPQEGIAGNPLSGANDFEWLLTVEWLLQNWRTAQGKRVLRGGCYLSSSLSQRVAQRVKEWGTRSRSGYGFRCVRSVTP